MATITAAPSSSIPAAPPGDHVGEPGEGGGAGKSDKNPKSWMTGHNSKTYECRTPDHGLGRRRPRNRRALRSSHWPKCVSSLQKLSLLSHFVSGMTYFWLTRKKTHVCVTLSGSGIYNATLHPRSYSQLAAELPMVWLHNNIFELWVCIQPKVFFLWNFHRFIFPSWKRRRPRSATMRNRRKNPRIGERQSRQFIWINRGLYSAF